MLVNRLHEYPKVQGDHDPHQEEDDLLCLLNGFHRVELLPFSPELGAFLPQPPSSLRWAGRPGRIQCSRRREPSSWQSSWHWKPPCLRLAGLRQCAYASLLDWMWACLLGECYLFGIAVSVRRIESRQADCEPATPLGRGSNQLMISLCSVVPSLRPRPGTRYRSRISLSRRRAPRCFRPQLPQFRRDYTGSPSPGRPGSIDPQGPH